MWNNLPRKGDGRAKGGLGNPKERGVPAQLVDAEFELVIQTAGDGLAGAKVEMSCECVDLIPQNI